MKLTTKSNPPNEVFAIEQVDSSVSGQNVSGSWSFVMALSRRSQTGGIIWILVCLGIVGFVFILFLIDVLWLHLVSEKEMTTAEKIALSVATELNKDDRIGQVNFTLARSRELLFCCRESQARAEQHHENLKPLAEYLVNKARNNARLISEDSHHLRKLRFDDACAIALATMANSNGPNAAKIPGMRTSKAKLVSLELGYVEDMESNLLPPVGNDLLLEYDKGAGFIDEKTNLYKGGINLKLPDDDSDLEYRICRVGAPIQNTVAPPRLALAKVFKPMLFAIKDGGKLSSEGGDYFPSAVSVSLAVEVQHDQEAPHKMDAGGVAVCAGANPTPED